MSLTRAQKHCLAWLAIAAAFALLLWLLGPVLMPFIKILSTPNRAARVITKILTDAPVQTGVYYDEGGRPMQGSTLVRDSKFQDRVVAETRALLATVPA